jgi:hypothetical protein
MDPIWKTTVTILSHWYPGGPGALATLAHEADYGDAICLGMVTTLAEPEDLLAAADFFEEGPDWVDSHDALFDEREAIGHGEDGAGDICPEHKEDAE